MVFKKNMKKANVAHVFIENERLYAIFSNIITYVIVLQCGGKLGQKVLFVI